MMQMIENLKKKIYEKIAGAGYHITDKQDYEELFPWVILRMTRMNRAQAITSIHYTVDYTLDIFSKYSGEAEIIQMENTISQLMDKLATEDATIMGVQLKQCRILDDKSTGTVLKHGILTYEFVLASASDEEAANGN